jgi:enoyl-CoA hydratase
MDASIITERDGDVGVVTIDREHVRNALNPPALRQMAELITTWPDDGVRAIVMTGAGTASFSSGMDLRAMRATPHTEVSEAVSTFDAAMNDDHRVPVIAAVNGSAVGGGFEIVLRCDLAVSADHAEFRLPEVQRGMVPGGGGTLLPSRIPLGIALEIGLLGQPITAMRAYHLGLINRIEPSHHVLQAAIALGHRIAMNGPRAVARTRQLMWKAAIDGAASAWSETRRSYDDPLLRSETEEGVASFIEKRKPHW